MKRFAEDTSVPIAKSRAELEKLLRDWQCDAIRWSDHWHEGRSRLEFTWTKAHETGSPAIYLARFDVELEKDAALRERAIDGRTGRPSDRKLAQLRDARGRREHRVLVLWIKAALNAVEAGLVKPEAIFLPWLVGKDGRTFGEVAVPRLSMLLDGSATKLLPVAS